MRRMAWTTAIAALLAASPVRAFEPAGIDIIGLRLGMQENEVVATLARQGYVASRTPAAITANTLDGRLQVTLSTQRGVTEINYAFRGYGAGEREKILEAMLTRFGEPDQAMPPTWCQAVSPAGNCPQVEASLTFLAGSLTLILREHAGATSQPGNRQSAAKP
jgi:hypothetical protein